MNGRSLATGAVALTVSLAPGPALTGGSSADDTPAGAVVALDLATGRQRWLVPPEPGRFYGHSFTDGRLLYTSNSAADCYGPEHLAALDAQTGAKRWRADSGLSAIGEGTGRGIVVVEDHGAGTVRGLDARSGKQRWDGTPVQGFASAAGPTLVFLALSRLLPETGAHDFAELRAIDRRDGRPRWTFRASDKINQASGDFNVVYSDRRSTLLHNSNLSRRNGNFMTGPDVLRVLDTKTGSERFRFHAQNSAAAVVVGSTIVYKDGGSLAARHLSSGAMRWQNEAENFRISASSAEDGAVYLIDNSADPYVLRAIDARTGKSRWDVNAPTVELRGAGGGIVLVQSTTRLAAIDAETGDTRWEISGAVGSESGFRVNASFARGMVFLTSACDA